MKPAVFMLLAAMMLSGCGDASDKAARANQAAAVNTDAVTAEAITDTQAAEADALKAADAELDRLNDNSIAEPAGNRASSRAQIVRY